MKKMRLVDLLCKISGSATVWISEDTVPSHGSYFGLAGEVPIKIAMGYDVAEVFPEYYPAISGCTGIAVIVKKAEEE